GTIFRLSRAGRLSTLYNFCSQANCSDGFEPWATLLQATDGKFYGTTMGYFANCLQNDHDYGTVFQFWMGLSPYLTFIRPAGKVGQGAQIMGQELAGTTNVSFNGTPASFTVVSDTYIRATVPPGATTGYVTVTTPSGTLTSNVPFHVIP